MMTFAINPTCSDHNGSFSLAAVMASAPESRIESSRGLSLIFGVCIFSRSIREVTSLCHVESDDAASDNSIEVAQKIINEASREMVLTIAPKSIDQFEGDLLIRWQYSNKTMMLICPARPESPAQIYREALGEYNSAKTHFIQPAGPSDLVNGMSWMLSGTSDL